VLALSERSLLNAEDVRRWHDNLREGSPRTAGEYLRWLADYCSKREMSPVEVISEFTQDKKAAQDRLEDYIRSLKDRGLKPKTLNGALCAIKSWFRFFELEVTRQIKIGNMRNAPTIEDEHPPSPEELNAILDHANQRTRAAVVLIAFAGIRPEAISRLKLRDLPELDISGEIRALKVPMLVRVRAELSKNRRPYFTFLVKRGVECLSAYLRERRTEGETLAPDSFIVTVLRTMSIKNRFMVDGVLKERGMSMGRKAVSTMMRRAIRSSNTSVSSFRPYVLRSYYDWALQNAGLNHVWEQFFMGHSGPIEEEYSVRKRLTDEQMEKMRSAFAEKVESALVGTSKVLSEEDVEKSAKLQYYWLGINNSPLKELSSEELLKAEELRRGEPLTLDDRLAILEPEFRELRKQEVDLMSAGTERLVPENHDCQKVINESELDEHLVQGWSFVASLPSGRIVVRR
jgi:integrase